MTIDLQRAHALIDLLNNPYACVSDDVRELVSIATALLAARERSQRVAAPQANPVNVEGPEHLAPLPAPGLAFDARGVLVPAQPLAADPDPALENCRLYAARHRKEEWAQTILRFCAEGGATGSPLRELAAEPAPWPEGLRDRIASAIERINNGHAPRRIPADPTDVDLVLAEVRYLMDGKDPPFWLARAIHQAEPVVAAPEMSRESRAMLLNVLWHHQGGSSAVGQPLRGLLGIGRFDHLSDEQLSEAKWIDALLAKAVREPR